MGGCATKPKVLKGEEGKAPVSASVPAKEPELAATAAVTESREVSVVAGGGDEVVKVKEEIVEVDDEQGGKRQSLSKLFKEKEGEELTESDKIPLEPEPVKQTETEKEQSEPLQPEEPTEAEKQNEFKQGQEAEKPSVPIEPTVIPDSVVTVENIETKTLVEDAPAPTPETKALIEDAPAPAPAPASAPKTETEKQVEEAK